MKTSRLETSGFCIGTSDAQSLEPEGLAYCRRNGLSENYDRDKWIIPEGSSDEHEELLIVGTTVIWTANGLLKKAFGFEEEQQEVRHALFVNFPSSVEQSASMFPQSSSRLGTNTESQSRIVALNKALRSTANVVHKSLGIASTNDAERALVIILDEVAYIYYLDGRRDIVNIPFKVSKAFAMKTGMVIERIVDLDEFPTQYKEQAHEIPKFFYLPDPLTDLGLLSVRSDESRAFQFGDEIGLLNDDILVTYNHLRESVSIWSLIPRHSAAVSSKVTGLKGGHIRRRSSMRSSLVPAAKQEVSEDDHKTSSTRNDVAHLDRTVSADVDLNILLNEVGSLRKDFEVIYVDTVSIGSRTQPLSMFSSNRLDLATDLYAFSASEELLVSVGVRKTSTGRLKVISQTKLPCQSAVPISVHGLDFVLIQRHDFRCFLQAPLSPDIELDSFDIKTPLRQYKDGLLGYDVKGELKHVQLDPGFTLPSITHVLEALQDILSPQHYRLFYAVLLDSRYRFPAESQLMVFMSTIFSLFLNTSQPCRDVSHEQDVSINFTVINCVNLADITCRRNDLSALQDYLPQILLCIHFVSEELGLDILKWRSHMELLPLLAQLSNWLKWESYVNYYVSHLRLSTSLALDDALNYLAFRVPSDGPPSVYKWIESSLSGSRDRLQTIEVLIPAKKPERHPYVAIQPKKRSVCPLTSAIARTFETLVLPDRSLVDLIDVMVEISLSTDSVERLPHAIALPIKEAIRYCGLNPAPHWDVQTLSFINREDLVHILNPPSEHHSSKREQATGEERLNSAEMLSASILNDASQIDDDFESEHHTINQLIFHMDRRMQEVTRMLRCHKTTVVQLTEVERLGEAEQLREQQRMALLVTRRTMAVPLGRGLLQFNSRTPVAAQKFPLAKLNFDVKFKPAQITVSEDKVAMTPAIKTWCQFHNGVAAGLSVALNSQEISASWIVYNKPDELTNGHAGFLLGLGLNGHLKAIATWHAFNYLTSKHTMTSIGLLLGLSASFIGTMEPMITKLLSVHILALLPPGSNDLNLSAMTQAAGVVGVGLLHFQTGHRQMSEVMLKEVADHDHSPDSFRDEGYRLAAGISLGFINVGTGGTQQGIRSLNVLRTLIECVQGLNRENHDLDVKMPGAIVALGLIYLKTGNKYVAGRLAAPSTHHDLNRYRPDLYVLRTLARGLIMWDEVEPRLKYVANQTPSILRDMADLKNIGWHNIDNLVLFNIVVGACLAIGIKYAGTLDLVARDFLLGYLDKFIAICDLDCKGVDQGSSAIACRTFLDTLAYCASMTMAGSGDLEVLRRLRRLHYRLHQDCFYGDYLAIEMSIGMLFLSGGQCSFSRTDLAICAYVAAFYPILPTSINDNRSHLQALRHLWVLGAEPRCVVPRLTDTNDACLVPIRIVFRDHHTPNIVCMAPCLLPPLELIASVDTSGTGFWPVSLRFGDNPAHLAAFRKDQTLYVKRRQVPGSPLELAMSNRISNSSTRLRVIASMVSKILPEGINNSEQLVSRALSSPESHVSETLSLRMTLINCLKDPQDQSKIDQVRLVLAYWEATERGILKHKFAGSARLLDKEFVQKLQLDLWRLTSGGV